MRMSILRSTRGSPILIAALTILLAAPASFAGAITFTGNVAFFAPQTNKATFPTVTGGAGTLNIFGIKPGGPQLNNTANGFEWTNVDVQYTAAAADVGKMVEISWALSRQFSNTAGMFTTTTGLTGSVVVPGGMITSIEIGTFFVSIGGPSTSMIKLGPYNANANLNKSMTTAAFMAPANKSDYLFQSSEIFLKPSAAGQVFKIDFPEIAEASAVPEPSTLVMAAIALPMCIIYTRRRMVG